MTIAVNQDILASDMDVVVPVGVVLPYAGATAPTDFLLCDGSSLLRSAYAALFAVIGTTFGAADGTHFNIPDMRGRVPIGVGTGTGGGASGTGLPTGGSALTAVALAGWKGEETHVLTEGELAAHTHGLTNVLQTQPDNNAFGTGATLVGTETSATGSTGSNTAHNNIQPVMGLNYIIKAIAHS